MTKFAPATEEETDSGGYRWSITVRSMTLFFDNFPLVPARLCFLGAVPAGAERSFYCSHDVSEDPGLTQCV